MAAVWIADVLKVELNYRDLGIESFSRAYGGDLCSLLGENKLPSTGAVEVIRDLQDKKGSSPQGSSNPAAWPAR